MATDSGGLCATRFDNGGSTACRSCVLPPGCEHGDSFASAAGNSSEMELDGATCV